MVDDLNAPAVDLAAALREGADGLTPYCVGDAEAPYINVELPAYLRQAASALSSLQERVRELEGASRKAVRLLSNSGLHELTRIADARDVLITTLERK